MTDKTDGYEAWRITFQSSEQAARAAFADAARLRAEVARLEAEKAEAVNRYKPDAERMNLMLDMSPAFWLTVGETGWLDRDVRDKRRLAIDTAMRGDREDG